MSLSLKSRIPASIYEQFTTTEMRFQSGYVLSDTSGSLLSRRDRYAEPVEGIREESGDFRGLAAFDLAAVQHIDRLAVLKQRH